MERHDARKAGNVGEKGGDAVVVATNLQVERALDEVLLTRRGTQSNEVDGELVVDSGFADAVEERRHLGPGRQHLLQRLHPGLELLHLLPDTLEVGGPGERKSTRLNSSHVRISYAVFCLKKKKKTTLHYNQNIIIFNLHNSTNKIYSATFSFVYPVSHSHALQQTYTAALYRNTTTIFRNL